MTKIFSVLLLILMMPMISCDSSAAVDSEKKVQPQTTVEPIRVTPGAYNMDAYLPAIQGKRIALVCNQTSEIAGNHLADTLRSRKINIVKAFAPEHGFRGTADAGEKVENQRDDSGIEIISLYGKDKKPTDSSLIDVDVVLFDIQDVGVRFYTYLSTLHYVMEACAENDVPLIVLDRPNPNGHYIDGPVLKTNERSFVGMHPVPIVYGLTIGEYARMINGEGWLDGHVRADLTVVECKHYTHASTYDLPIPPSPNLPNARSIELYPSLALFEGTSVSIGRGTDFPFQVVGHPGFSDHSFSFTPTPGYGSKYPKLEGKKCYGMDLRRTVVDSIVPERLDSLRLDFVIDMYQDLPDKRYFFLKNKFFDKLSGTSLLMSQIKEKLSEEEIKKSWEVDLNIYLLKRQKYLLYED